MIVSIFKGTIFSFSSCIRICSVNKGVLLETKFSQLFFFSSTNSAAMPIVLYQESGSPPCAAVQMTAEHLGIKMVSKHVDLVQGDHMKPKFLAINPQHCVPTIDDDGFILWESRAIMRYLISKYAPESPLYPKDINARAVVDKMLDFDLGNLFKNLSGYWYPQLFSDHTPTAEETENLKKSLDIFEKLLENTPYAAGNHLTIADYSMVTIVVFGEVIFDHSFDDYPKISAWLQRIKKETPKFKEINTVPLEEFKDYLKSSK